MMRALAAGTSLPLLFALSLAASAATEPAAPTEFPVPAPPLSEGIFPCSDCHVDLESDPTPRELGMHEEIVASFHHAEEQRWCLDCHNPDDRDRLRLANGQLIGFEESYKLCGQCHGEIYRDWKAGVHGKRTGMWNGAKEYRLCVHCHDPHRPRFAPLAPEPAPRRPAAIKGADQAPVAPAGHDTHTDPGSK
jgi:hypothetical protein